MTPSHSAWLTDSGVSCAAGSACRSRSGGAVAGEALKQRLARRNRRDAGHAGEKVGSSAAGPGSGRDSFTPKLDGASTHMGNVTAVSCADTESVGGNGEIFVLCSATEAELRRSGRLPVKDDGKNGYSSEQVMRHRSRPAATDDDRDPAERKHRLSIDDMSDIRASFRHGL